MTAEDLYLVLEALKSAQTEFEALVDDDIYVPAGQLIEQIEQAITTVEKYSYAE